jgi:transposase
VEEKQIKTKHSEEFKLEAIELANRIGTPKAANELGVHETSIRTWKRKYQTPSDFIKNSNAKKTYEEIEKENKKLQKENSYLKEINKVLKKSTAIFSAEHMGNLK